MTDRDSLRAAFDAIGVALASNDLAALTRLYADDYRGHGVRGEVEDRDLLLATYAPGGVQQYRMADVELEFEVHGGVGVVSGRGLVSGSFAGTPFAHRVRFLEVYLWRDARWQCHRAQCTEIVGA
ncbi:MAG: nuclear transport factor 2 family protein [Thermoanaerobaculaceae bacterium]